MYELSVVARAASAHTGRQGTVVTGKEEEQRQHMNTTMWRDEEACGILGRGQQTMSDNKGGVR